VRCGAHATFRPWQGIAALEMADKLQTLLAFKLTGRPKVNTADI
jgi:hypothetical protein